MCGYDKCIKALQFHHKDSMQKDFEIADFYNSSKFDIERLKNEVDKCTLLCSNCHIEIHDIENFKQ